MACVDVITKKKEFDPWLVEHPSYNKKINYFYFLLLKLYLSLSDVKAQLILKN